MSDIWFWTIILIVTAEFLLSFALKWLNYKSLSSIMPSVVKDIYDADKYAKSQEYTKVNLRFSFFTSAFSFLVIMVMLFSKGFAYVDSLAEKIAGDNPVSSALVFFGILFFANEIITLPFSIYDTFVIENKFGFNRTTVKTFILDKIKSWLLTIVIGGGLLALLVWFYTLTLNYFWLYAWAVFVAFSLFITMFYSNLIVPLFNKQTPLEQGELRDAIAQFAKQADFEIENIYVIDGSKRSTKANAYFTGFGRKKRIVLYDSLIEQMETPEIVAVLAHEIGHYKHKHILKNFIISTINTGIILFVFSLVVRFPQISQALGVDVPKFHIALIAFSLLYSPVSTLTGVFVNILSRKFEFQADNFTKKYNLQDKLISALKKLAKNNLSNLTPHPLYVFFYYSHPTIVDRIKNLEN